MARDLASDVLAAHQRIAPHIRATALEPSSDFGDGMASKLFFKCENLQHTGSFKVRGALSKALSLSADELSQGVITASTGNHGAACAYALAKVGVTATIYVPHNASAAKLANIERFGGSIHRYGEDSAHTEAYAREQAANRGAIYLPPYNDRDVIAGQGTVALELLQALKQVDAVFVSLGGGGLVSGIAAYVKSISPNTRIVACSPSNSEIMFRSVRAGRIVDDPSLPTLSDGTAGGVEPGAITFPLVRELVDEYVSVSEAEIASAIRRMIDCHHMLIEGAAGVACAAYLKTAESWRAKHVVVVLCGANIDRATLRGILNDAGD